MQSIAGNKLHLGGGGGGVTPITPTACTWAQDDLFLLGRGKVDTNTEQAGRIPTRQGGRIPGWLGIPVPTRGSQWSVAEGEGEDPHAHAGPIGTRTSRACSKGRVCGFLVWAGGLEVASRGVPLVMSLVTKRGAA